MGGGNIHAGGSVIAPYLDVVKKLPTMADSQ